MRAHAIVVVAALFAALGSSAACRHQPDPLPKPPPPPLEYLGEWGAKGDGPGQLSRPVSLATDALGNVYVADPGSGFVHKFDPQGHPLLSFKDERLGKPAGIAVDRGGAIYVTDPRRGSVFIFLPDGERFREIRARPGQRRWAPVGVTVDDEGSLFVVARVSNQIEKFSPRGRLLKAWALQRDVPDQIVFPAAATVGPDGFLYVVDRQAGQVQKFTREGEFISRWGEAHAGFPADGTDEVSSGIAVSEKYVFLADAAHRGVRVWTLDGQQKLADDLGGRLRSEVSRSFVVAFSPRGELLVLDSAGPRVLRFRINF